MVIRVSAERDRRANMRVGSALFQPHEPLTSHTP
jgi:hypothetical protein